MAREASRHARLDLNESPFPPPGIVMERVREELRRVNRYPEAELVDEAYRALSEYTGVDRGYLAITCGGDSALYTLFTMLASPKGSVVVPRYTFSVIKRLPRLLGLKVHEVPMVERGASWRIDVEELYEAARGASLTVIDRPNNPTGSMLAESREILELAEESRGFVLVDEAYHEFSRETLAASVPSHGNLVIVRTLSKAFSLAGLRIGYIIAPKELASKIRELNPYPTTRPSLAAVAAYTQPQAMRHLEKIVAHVDHWKETIRGRLEGAGMKAYESKANFLLIETGVGDAKEKLEELGVKTRKVEIRDTMIRASIGKRWENEKLIKALRRLRKQSKARP